jgi:methionyl-tRNA synthetase
LKTAFYPYLPFTSERLHGYLGHADTIESRGWELNPPEAGRAISEPQPLFRKLDPEIIEQEDARFGT